MTSLATSCGVSGFTEGGFISLPTGATATMIFRDLSYCMSNFLYIFASSAQKPETRNAKQNYDLKNV
jgi:hypothetical protein